MESLKIEHKENYAIVEIANGKVNAINTVLARDLGLAFKQLEADDKVKGIILTGRPHCFSAGLDVMHFATNTVEQNKEFWRVYLSTLQTMVRYSKPFVCAITGFAPAGGTILALCADYRVMGKGEKHKIGMHEFKMSMQIPELMCDIYAYHLGEKYAWEAVQQAKLYSSDEALKIGLVNESAEVEEVLSRAERALKYSIKVHPPVYQKSKRYLRKALLAKMDRPVEPMVEVIAKEWEDPFVRQSMDFFLAGLKK